MITRSGLPFQAPGYHPAMDWVRARCLAMLLVTLGCVACYVAGWNSPIRVAVTLVFLLFVPGYALAELGRVRDGLERLAVAIGASLAAETLIAVAFLYGGIFTAGRVFAVVAVSTGVCTVLAATRPPQTQ